MRRAFWLEATATSFKLVSADMASLPPLRARAVTSYFSDCLGLDDAVRSTSHQPEETVAEAIGWSSGLNLWMT